jgi:hypothetical protein
MWRVTCRIGFFWDGPVYVVGTYRFRWVAHLMAKAELWVYPLRTCTVEPIST